MTNLKLAPVIIFAAIAAMFAFALTTSDPSKLPSMLIGKPVPAMAFPPVAELTDKQQPVPGFSDKDLARGEISVVNFWASWCGPCRAEHPVLEALVRRTKVALYGVNYKDQAVNARRFLGQLGNPYKAVGTDLSGRAAIEWGVYGMPETFIVNGKGEIIYKHVGPVSLRDLAERFVPLIKKARGGGVKGE